MPLLLSTRWTIFALLMVGFVGFDSGTAAPAALSQKLYWDNGESLTGSLLAASPGRITWQSDLFAQPVELDTAPLLLIASTLQDRELKAEPSADFKIVLTNGDCLFADIVCSNDKGLVVRSARHGEIVLPFASVERLTRVRGGTALFAGPRGVEGWPGTVWETGVGGSLTTYACYRSGKLELKLPERMSLDFTVSASARLQFAFRIYHAGIATTEISLWDGFLVLTSADGPRFTPLLTLKPGQQRLSLRILWDRSTHTSTVLDGAGQLLGASPPPDLAAVFAAGEKPVVKPNSSTPKEGVYLINDSKDLTLERLVIRPWNGELPPQQPGAVGSSVAELADGSRVEGLLKAGRSASEVSLQPKAGGATATFPISLLEDYRASESLPSQTSPFDAVEVPGAAANLQCQLQWLDGTQLTGTIQRIAAGQVEMHSALFEAPIAAPLAEITRLVFTPNGRLPPRVMKLDPSDPFASADSLEAAGDGGDSDDESAAMVTNQIFDSMDVMKTGKTSLHGLICGGDGVHLRWRLLGAVEPVTIRCDVLPDLQITRHQIDIAPLNPPPAALFLLADDSLFAGNLRSIDDSGITLSSPYVPGLQSLEQQQLRAVHFLPTPKSNEEEDGFEGDDWTTVWRNKRQERTDTGIVLSYGDRLGNQTAMASGSFEFDLRPQRLSCSVQVSMFAENALDDSGDPFVIRIIHSGNQVAADTRDRSPNGPSKKMRVEARQKVRIRIDAAGSHCRVFANDLLLLDAPIPEDQHAGKALVFEPSDIWRGQTEPVVLSDFHQDSANNGLRELMISEKTKREALTIPRFRRDVVPSHALIASNSDILRGHIDAATPELIKFSSGLETQNIPSTRVASILWLAKPKTEGTKQVSTENTAVSRMPTLRLVLRDGTRLALAVDSITDSEIVGQAPTLGLCRIPLDRIAMLQLKVLEPTKAIQSYHAWQLSYAPEPVLPETSGDTSPLLGKPAPDFTLGLLEGGKFSLKSERGHVVVLDFWATWCGPCVSSLPELMKTISGFNAAKVKLIGVNQGEPAAQVARFLKQRSWPLRTVLDVDQKIGTSYGVDGIPHTVLIGPDGQVVWTATGYHSGGGEELAEEIRKVLK